MLTYIARRILGMIPTLIVVSILTFIIIQLPPGDFLTTLSIQAAQTGSSMDEGAMEALRRQYGLDQPMFVQYLSWIAGFPRGDFGYSIEWKTPVADLIGSRLGVACASLANIFQPNAIVIGGGVIAAGDLLLEPARREVRQRALRPMNETPILEATLGNDAGMIGAAAMARNEVAEVSA